MKTFVVVLVVGLPVLAGALYWWVRRPPETGDHVSAEWRDEHIGNRRE